jgi:hypothetical protein
MVEGLRGQQQIADEVAAEIVARVISSRGGAAPAREARFDAEAYELVSRARYTLSQYVSTLFPEYLTQAKEDDRRSASDRSRLPGCPGGARRLLRHGVALAPLGPTRKHRISTTHPLLPQSRFLFFRVQ